MRPTSTSVWRSQVRRGRSSANSSDGIAPGEHVEHAGQRARATARDSSRRGGPRARARRPRHGSAATIATICCASTSSALSGTRIASTSPSSIRCATTVASSRSPRNFGRIRPMLVPPTWWPARPIRCSPRETAPGDSTWTHEIDRAHVDAELERAGRGDRAQPAGLERLLDLEPLVARDRAVVRAHQLDVRAATAPRRDRELGQLLRHALGEPPRVDEDDRRAVREDQLEQPRVDQRPHAAAVAARGARVVHVGRGHDDLRDRAPASRWRRRSRPGGRRRDSERPR